VCWCGNADLVPFGSGYGECRACGTLVALTDISAAQLLVSDDENDFYGKKYWLEHQTEAGYPQIHARARHDLTERNLHWLDVLLKYRLPPAVVLEVGCAHGSFVALMRQAGYEASGLEMSPWVVAFGQKTFGVPIRVGPIENLDRPLSSLDIVILMDVLEHLLDPITTIRRCLELLKPNGLLLIQTPCFDGESDLETLRKTKSRFIEMLIPDEHIHLFSRRSITELLRRLGVEHVDFEPPIFPHYDMFLIAGREPRRVNVPGSVESALLSTPDGRFVLALLDIRERELELARRLEAVESDRAARGEQVETLTAMLGQSESDRAARGEQIGELTTMVRQSESDRAVHSDRVKTLTAQIARLESDQDLIRALLARMPIRWLLRFVPWRDARILIDRHPASGTAAPTIAVDLTPLLPGADNGGAKIFVLELLRRLAELFPETQFVLLTQRASHQELAALDRKNVRRLMVLEPVAEQPRWLLQRVSHLTPSVTRLVGRVAGNLRRVLKRRRPGTLLRNLNANLLFCPFTAATYFEPGVPTVCTIYDLQYKAYPQFFTPDEVAERDHTFKEACLRATMLVAISEYSRCVAIAQGQIDPASIRTIHLRMAERASSNATRRSDILASLGLARRKYVIYPANFWRHKNHEMLLTAFGIACRSGLPADLKLVCTGASGPRQRWLERAADRMMLGGRVLFPGFLSDADFSMLMANSLAVVYPSLYEGFGLPLIEAMAAGVPVACSKVTSLPEVAGNAAMFFDPCIPTEIVQAIVSLVDDDRLRAKLIEAGNDRAAEFSDPDGMARSYREVFLHALRNPRLENMLIGAYSDGWSGPRLTIQVAPDEAARTLEIEVAAPEWLPASELTVRFADGRSFSLARGGRVSCSTAVDAAGGRYEAIITPTFVPAHLGPSEDQRELSAMLVRCSIISAAGRRVELVPTP
jgi:glycosyltransferase involved in cell wall biosynthesis/SAM-dependent methyltransferase